MNDVGNGSPDSEFLILAHLNGSEGIIGSLQEDPAIHLAESLYGEFPVDHCHNDLTV